MVGVKCHSGGRRRGSGRPQRKPLDWPEEYTLDTPENWAAFLKHLVKVTYEAKLSERVAGAINNTMRLLADGRGWISKAPLQIIQAQVMQPGAITEADLAELLSELPEDERRKLWEKAKERRLRNAVSRPGQS
jgi:hypothetical protein